MRPILRPEFLEFDLPVAKYQQVFGKMNCCVLPLELLSRSSRDYVATFCAFMNVPTGAISDHTARNVGRGGAALSLARILNAFYVVSPLSFEPSFAEALVTKILNVTNRIAPTKLNDRIERKWRSRIEERYSGQFAFSNRRLEELTGLDLRAMGYQ